LTDVGIRETIGVEEVMSHGIKITNEYSQAIGRMYAETPKAVFAAIAVSFCSTGGEQLPDAEENLLREWTALWYSGIVTQKPPRLVDGLGARP
jgi:hypothetical protein